MTRSQRSQLEAAAVRAFTPRATAAFERDPYRRECWLASRLEEIEANARFEAWLWAHRAVAS